MKINVSNIKKWDFNKRLNEIEKRLENTVEMLSADPKLSREEIGEALQIIKYWKNHMRSKEDKPKKNRTKPVNLW